MTDLTELRRLHLAAEGNHGEPMFPWQARHFTWDGYSRAMAEWMAALLNAGPELIERLEKAERDHEAMEVLRSFPSVRLSNKSASGYWWCYVGCDDSPNWLVRQGADPAEVIWKAQEAKQ